MDVVELTQKLVRIPSVSGNEQGCVDLLREVLPQPSVSGRNIWATRGEGPQTLLLNSHTDTVPPTDAWTIHPHAAEIEDGKIFGLGANDAKGPLAALVCAFLRAKVPEGRRLVLAATCDEETGGEGLDMLRPALPKLSAAIIGEPTHLQVCCGQRGLLRLRLTARGKAAHAARPWEGVNAIERAAQDVSLLASMVMPEHPLLGAATLQVTMIRGGVRPNVVPPECVMEVDARTVPALDNQKLYHRVRRDVQSAVTVVSDRFSPVVTSNDEAIVRAARIATGHRTPIAFGGVSDLFHVRDVPGIVLGPGRSDQSHAADEWIEVEQLEKAVAVYLETIERYFA